MIVAEMQRHDGDEDDNFSYVREMKEDEELMYRALFIELQSDNDRAVEDAIKRLLSFLFTKPSRTKVSHAIERGATGHVFRSMTEWFDDNVDIVADCLECLSLFTCVENCKLNSGEPIAGISGQLLKKDAIRYVAACLLPPFESNKAIQLHSLAVLGNIFWYEQENQGDIIFAVKFVEEMDGLQKVIRAMERNAQDKEIVCKGCYLLSILSYFRCIRERILDSGAMAATAEVVQQHRNYKTVKTSAAIFMRNVLWS